MVGTSPVLHRAQPKGRDGMCKRGKKRGIVKMIPLGLSCFHVLEKVKVKVTQLCLTLCQNSQGQITGVRSLSLLQGIFPTKGLNPGLPHYRQILYQLSHKGSLRIPEWGAFPFSRGSSRLRNQIGFSCIPGGFLTNWAMREAQSESESCSVVSNSLRPHGQFMEFSKPEHWSW